MASHELRENCLDTSVHDANALINGNLSADLTDHKMWQKRLPVYTENEQWSQNTEMEAEMPIINKHITVAPKE